MRPYRPLPPGSLRLLGAACLLVAAGYGCGDPPLEEEEPPGGLTGYAAAVQESQATQGLDLASPEIRTIKAHPNITASAGIDPRFSTNYDPDRHDLHQIHVRHLGAENSDAARGAVSRAVGWDPVRFSGLQVPAPLSAWQRGCRDHQPHSVFQIHGREVGWLFNSFAFDHSEVVRGGGPNVQWRYIFSQPESVWRTRSSALTLQAKIKIPWVYPPPSSPQRGIGQLTLNARLRDIRSGKTFPYVMQVFDTRPAGVGNGREFVSHDTFTPFVSCPLRPGMRYCTVSPYSQVMKNVYPFADYRFFRVHITWDNLEAALTALNAAGAGLSPDPADYRLAVVNVLNEYPTIDGHPEKNISMGVAILAFNVYEFY